MSSTELVRAQVTHHFQASAEAVYDAWLTGSKVRQWFAPGLGEMTRVAIEPRVGGVFSFVQRRGLDEVDHTGQYQELVRPNRIVFTWSVKGTDHRSRVMVDIEPSATGCELVLTHELQPLWADYRERMEASWAKMLTAMAAAIA